MARVSSRGAEPPRGVGLRAWGLGLDGRASLTPQASGLRPEATRLKPFSRFELCDGAGLEAAGAGVGDEHVDALVEFVGGDGVDDLLLQREGAGDAAEFGLAEEAVVEAPAAA